MAPQHGAETGHFPGPGHGPQMRYVGAAPGGTMRYFVLLALAVAGCYSGGVKVTEQQVRKFEVGKTTYAEVVKELGPPTSVMSNSNGTRSASYSYVMAKAKAASFIPVVGLFAG